MTSQSAEGAFLDAMQRAGVGTPPRLVADGRIHRFVGDGDKPGKANAWYVLHVDGGRPAGAYGSWRTDVSETWCSGDAGDLSDAERAELRRQVAEARRKAAAEREEAQQATASSVWREWSQAEPASPKHPYAVRKGVSVSGLRQRGNLLLVPLSDVEGRVWNLQRIAPDGTKRFAKGGRITGLFKWVGPWLPVSAIFVAEGWATAATLSEATGLPVLAAMNRGNLEAVAKVARRKWPEQQLVIAADNDHQTPSNPGLTDAKHAALATGALLVCPPTRAGVTDFNDLGAAETHSILLAAGVTWVTGVTIAENTRKTAALGCSHAVTRCQKPVLRGVIALGVGR